MAAGTMLFAVLQQILGYLHTHQLVWGLGYKLMVKVGLGVSGCKSIKSDPLKILAIPFLLGC